MNKLPVEKKIAVVAALVEGCSIRSTARLNGGAKSTIPRLLAEVCTAFAEYQNSSLTNLKTQHDQVDEIWAVVGGKQKNVTEEIANASVAGDVWTWVALESTTKLAISWLVGQRDAVAATEFIQDLAKRLANRVQLTSDGLKLYLNAIIDAFADDI